MFVKENPDKKKNKKIENFDDLQLPQGLIFFAELLHTFPTHHCLQKGVRDFFYFAWILSY